MKQVAADYTDIFKHINEKDCPLAECRLKRKGCSSLLGSQKNIVIGDKDSKYSIMAKKDNSYGYKVTFCYECKITPLGYRPIYFRRNLINIWQTPLSCSRSLRANNRFRNKPPFKFKDTENRIEIASDYTKIFNHK